jgi:hypothetical protein
MAFLVQQCSSREAEKTAGPIHRLPYSRSNFGRVAHAGGTLYEVVPTGFEEALAVVEGIPKAAESISVGLERVSVSMEEPRPKPKGRPQKDAPKRPIERTYRMAWGRHRHHA